MAKRTQHTIGLDIGTSKVTCIAGEPGEGGLLEVVGIGEAEARGLRKGVIVNPDAAVDAIKKAVEDAERMSGLEAEEVTINLAGSHILGFNGQAIVAVSGRDREIVAEDVRRAGDSACAIPRPAGRGRWGSARPENAASRDASSGRWKQRWRSPRPSR
jgi:cell division protein FtsA